MTAAYLAISSAPHHTHHQAHDHCRAPDHQPTAAPFEKLLPAIQRAASYSFRHVPAWRREELIADVVATAYATYVRLIELGKAVLAYASLLAKQAIRSVRSGRSFGIRQATRDVLSAGAQRRHGFAVERLSGPADQNDWQQLTTSRRASPSDIAACRIDFRSWLKQLQPAKRRLALVLARGTTTQEAAGQFAVSPGRISQLRRELAASWSAFQALPVCV